MICLVNLLKISSLHCQSVKRPILVIDTPPPAAQEYTSALT